MHHMLYLFILASACLLPTAEAKLIAQTLTVARDAEGKIVYTMDDDRQFRDLDACITYCQRRRTHSNVVDIHIRTDSTPEQRQALGDAFIEKSVYPRTVTWLEDGTPRSGNYRPNAAGRWYEEAEK